MIGPHVQLLLQGSNYLFENFKDLVMNDFVTKNIYIANSIHRSALRNWLFQVSKDGKTWTTLYTHTDDNSLNEPG